jgi:hypothetical protein
MLIKTKEQLTTEDLAVMVHEVNTAKCRKMEK